MRNIYLFIYFKRLDIFGRGNVNSKKKVSLRGNFFFKLQLDIGIDGCRQISEDREGYYQFGELASSPNKFAGETESNRGEEKGNLVQETAPAGGQERPDEFFARSAKNRS